MEFFDKKEEVIDLKLTQYGRHLLAKGKFSPKYYSFFDDNVLYDSSKAGISELQNDSEKRIRETPTMKTQISISSLDKQFANQYTQVFVTGEAQVGDETLQRTPEKNYYLPSPMGMSDVNSEFAPSWSVRYLNGSLSGSVKNINLNEKNGGNQKVFIPQLDSHVIVKVDGFDPQDQLLEDEFEQGPFLADYEIVSEEKDLFILLKVSENNSFFQKKNFDIEVFEIEEENQNGTVIETLRPLRFPEQQEVLSATGIVTEEADFDPETDPNYVDYYLDILIDEEIDQELVCELDPDVDQTLGVFADPRTQECQDIINKRKKAVFNIYEDEADIPGEIC